MTIFNLPKEAADLSLIDIGKKTETVSTNGLKMLFPFGTHDVGLLRFKGSTPWEEHPNDEFLLVVEGETTLTLRTEQGEVSSTARKGDVLVVPGKTWHRQDAPVSVTLMFITNHEGNRHHAAS
ncbi:cupin domain-containing protein [Gluconobacter cerinus]|uniref:cupin domain-containing protein n=1 Tax=Gluconobacter cerinus TaxID=38307 RepID=UPI001B8B0419|nr:cupin domain-containing protein [Gluconobacter cerinus]MBS1034287.1 cupin domain-containing protein [Gluconobacter cerinus]MBS1040087.1 cupin domain-containing protein [Gluconobacter cerinus]MBS1046946.1 cupin domain-containing protein [Gluconobacter cerinus]